MLCGCPGSGTSLVAKILRHSGLFLGADAGPLDARKYHESQTFKQANIRFLSHTIDFPHAPKSTEQFQSHNLRMSEEYAKLAKSVDCDQLLSEFVGHDGCQLSKQPWGWKDPRNSATALIWREVFPQLRALVICRRWRWRDKWKSGGSESGIWYRKHSTAKLRSMYENPIGLDDASILRVDVDQLTSDRQVLQGVLDWCKLSVDPSLNFDNFMQAIGLER